MGTFDRYAKRHEDVFKTSPVGNVANLNLVHIWLCLKSERHDIRDPVNS